MRNRLFATLLLGTMAVPTFAQIDGTVGASEGYTRYAVQNNETGFGNNSNELDALYAKKNGTAFDLAITGNLDNNNGYLLFFDVGSGGSSTLNTTAGPGYLRGQNGLKFDTDFAPRYALALNRSSDTVFYDLVDLTGNTSTFLGSHAINGSGSITGGTAAFNNSNTLGVSDVSGAGGDTATTGLELELNSAALNLPASFKVAALITNNSDGYASNQVLGGLGGGMGNLAFGTSGSSGASKIDFSAVGGNQFVVVPAPSSALVLLAGVPMIGLALRRKK